MSQLFHVTKLESAAFNGCQQALQPVVVPIEQSPLWGKFDNAIAGRHYLGSWRYDRPNGQLVALASATLYRQRGRHWIWIKHGPLFAQVPNTSVIKKMCATLQHQFTEVAGSRPSFIRLTMPTRVAPLRLPFEHTMYDQTVIIDLTQPETKLLASMSQSGRQGIRKATKAQVEVKEVPRAQATKQFSQHFYPILADTARRSQFGIHPASLYQKMLTELAPHARLYGAYYQGQVVAWALTTEYAGHGLYYYGASNLAARDSHAPYLLHWEIIKTLKDRGNTSYDLMGIAGKHYPSLKNVSQFKLKFSKDIVDIPPTYDLPLRPRQYQLLAQAIKFKRLVKRS